MSTLQDRMVRALAYRQSISTKGESVNQSTLARYCGVKTPSVTNWFNGRTKELTVSNLIRAAEYLKVNKDWLAGGRGPMVLDHGELPRSPINHQNFIPVVGLAALGSSDDYFEEVQPSAKEGYVVVKLFAYERSGLKYFVCINEASAPFSIPQDNIEAVHYVAGLAKSDLYKEAE